MPLLAISTLRTGLWPPSARTYAATLAKRGAAPSAAAADDDGAPAASAEAMARERGGGPRREKNEASTAEVFGGRLARNPTPLTRQTKRCDAAHRDYTGAAVPPAGKH